MASSLVTRLESAAAFTDANLQDLESGSVTPLAELLEAARVRAAELAARPGAGRGARVLLSVAPGRLWAESFLGILLAGSAAVPVPLGAPAAEVEHLARDSGAALLLSDEPIEGAGGLARVDARAQVAGPAHAPSATDGDVALVLYTSGTTGRPRGAAVTHANLAAQTAALRSAWGFTERDVLLHALPMHHLHGVVVAFLTALTAPCSIRMLKKFDATRVARELERATVFMGVPTMYQRLADLAEAGGADAEALARGARGLRLATSGSAALPATLAERWRAVAGAIPLERYGMTEIGVALSNPLDPAARRAGTVGLPLPGVDVRVVSEEGRDIDGPGELWVRGPSVFAGYLGRPDATAASFDGAWFKTGDVVSRDDGGFFRILGRRSVDILKTGGEKVSALEIEEALREHPAVADVAVVGLPDEAWGERVVAAVVPRYDVGAAELRSWAKKRLVAYKVPRDFAFVSELPKNAMGKVQKTDLVKRLTGP